MNYELFIALRYLKSKRKTGFISLISYISVAGVAIGVASLIIVLSVFNGFESEVRSKFIGVNAHLKVRTFHNRGEEDPKFVMEQIKDIPQIKAMAPYILNTGFIVSKFGQSGVICKGIDPKKGKSVTVIDENLDFGLLELEKIAAPDGEGRAYPGIVLGFHLADRLNVTVGDKVTVFSASNIEIGPIPQMPPGRTFRVADYFQSGLFEYDNTMAYMSIPNAQKLFQMGSKVSGVELKLDDYMLAFAVQDTINNRLGYPRTTETWWDTNRSLYTWMKLEKWAAFIVLCLIIMVAAFNIISTMIMITMEKTREIGVLKAMGAPSKGIQKIFTFEGLLVGIAGTIVGLVFGYSLCWAQITYKFFSIPGDVYIIDWLPVRLEFLDFLFVALVSILITFLAAVYPARHAAKLDPVNAIRYE